jgi:hypothetical protein
LNDEAFALVAPVRLIPVALLLRFCERAERLVVKQVEPVRRLVARRLNDEPFARGAPDDLLVVAGFVGLNRLGLVDRCAGRLRTSSEKPQRRCTDGVFVN